MSLEQALQISSFFNKDTLHEIYVIVKDFSKIVFPQILFFCCMFLQGTINLFFISFKYKDSGMLNAVGISNLYVNITTAIILLGIFGALDTLASNAYGAKNYKLWGIYFDRCRYISIIYFIFITMFHYLFARSILGVLKVEDRIIDWAWEYISIYVFSQWFNINFQINTKHFVLLEKSYYNLITAAISLVLHTFWCWFFVCLCDIGIRGASISCLVVSIFNMVSAWILIHRWDWPEGSLIYFSKEGLQDWGSYMKIALPGILISGGEWWGYEIQGISAIYMSTQAYSTMIISMNLECIWFPYTNGINNAIGMKSGERLIQQPETLPFFIKVCYGFSFVLSLIVWMSIKLFGNVFFRIMAPDDEIYESCLGVKGYVEYYVFLLNCYYFFLGILKGFGYLNNPTYWTFFVFYIVELSLTILLGFKSGMGVRGIWLSLSIGITICTIIFIYWVLSFDIEDWKSKAMCRIECDEKKVLRFEMKEIQSKADLEKNLLVR